MQNVKRMLEELLWARYRKLVKTVTQNQKLPSDLLTVEEAKMCEDLPLSVAHTESSLKTSYKAKHETAETSETEVSHKRMSL